MNSKTIKFFLLILLGVLFTLSNINAEGGDKGGNGNTLEKPGSPIRAYMNINFISTIIKNTGVTDINAGQDASGLIYPKGSGKTAVYQAGFLWAANCNVAGENDPHVGGTVYREGTQSGWIDALGNVIPEADPSVRIWRVRPDVYYGGVDDAGLEIPKVDLGSEALDELGEDTPGNQATIREQYDLDWEEWPASVGAPYADLADAQGNLGSNGQYDPDPNGDGIYGPMQIINPGTEQADTIYQDVPGVPGANQTIWFVANDQAASRTSFMYGTQPMGMEMQATMWAYSQTGALGNMYFRRYVLINKTDVLPLASGPRTFDSMYVSMWCDPDVGDAGDDYAGCDTVLSVSYAYNGKGQDAIYGGTVPAVGFDFFQGPLVEGVAGEDKNKNGVDDAEDYAIFKNKRVGPGLINLPMTAAYYYINQDPTLTDPVQGSYEEGAIRWYRFMQGRIGLTNEPFVDPNTGQQTPFTLPGDPVTGTGWIDGQQFAYADRRIGMASGPFNMAPGDTQEVVVAEILAGAITGVDRLSAVSLMKFYDQIAQVAYDNFFDLPTPPPAPVVTIAELNNEIVLDWSKDVERVALTESSDIKGYKFQGYNVYQLPTASSSPSEGVRLATYDIIDGVGKIYDLVFDPATGSVVSLPVQFGNDVGIKRFISIKEDAINQVPLVNGNRYYLAVTAYNYNDEFGIVPNNLENPLRIYTVIPHSPNPGTTYGQGTGSEMEITHTGTADGGPTVTIVDPTVTTGHEYELSFISQPQIRNENGFWVPAGSSIILGPNGIDTLTGSSILISAIYPPTPGQPVELHFVYDYVSPDGNWCDGIELDFPVGMVITDFPSFEAGGGTITPVITGDPSTGYHIEMGDVTGILSGDGVFHGGESWIVYVELFTPPQTFDWVIWDDGWSGGAVNAVGSTTVDAIGYAERVARLWQLQDMETSDYVIKDESLINGTILYPHRDDDMTDVGVNASPIVDGFQINVNVGYDAPLTTSTNLPPTLWSIDSTETPPIITGTEFSGGGFGNRWSEAGGNYIITDFTYFGYADGTVYSTLGPAGYVPGAGGSTDINLLQQDLVFRWTGVTADTLINDSTLTITSYGGSMVTLIGASGYDIADHPLNPTGTDDPFAIRVPFEIWNVDTGEQINALMWDRSGNPTLNGGAAWNETNREYIWLVNTPYTESAIDPLSQDVTDFGSWNVVWYASTFTLGDSITINYDNPIQIGTDKYTFSTTASSYSSSLAQNQVNEINVFPNPYYGFSSEELNKYNRFVTFTHLPEKANIRIFNLAGVLVSSFEKDDISQFAYWDLNNNYGLPVASGLYIVYIEMPDVGTTKILKVAIIQEQQVLDRF